MVHYLHFDNSTLTIAHGNPKIPLPQQFQLSIDPKYQSPVATALISPFKLLLIAIPKSHYIGNSSYLFIQCTHGPLPPLWYLHSNYCPWQSQNPIVLAIWTIHQSKDAATNLRTYCVGGWPHWRSRNDVGFLSKKEKGLRWNAMAVTPFFSLLQIAVIAMLTILIITVLSSAF